MKFRLHRGSLAESMETCVDLPATRASIVAHLNALPLPMFNAIEASIQVKPYGGPDNRIGWAATYIVSDHTGVIGFTDGPIQR